MTRHAVDVEQRVFLAAYATVAGDIGFTVAAPPADVAQDTALRVVTYLDRLSRVMWRRYTHPAKAAWDDCRTIPRAGGGS